MGIRVACLEPASRKVPDNMPRRYIALLLLQALSALAGCANNDYFEPTALVDLSNSMVYVYRPAASNPGKKPLITSYPEILVDGQTAGLLKYKEYLAIELPPGRHEIVATGLTRDARWEPEDSSYKLLTEAGKSYFMRFRVEYNTAEMSLGTFRGQYLIHLHPVDEGEAVYQIRENKNSAGN